LPRNSSTAKSAGSPLSEPHSEMGKVKKDET
jgi:hypothetical protein